MLQSRGLLRQAFCRDGSYWVLSEIQPMACQLIAGGNSRKYFSLTPNQVVPLIFRLSQKLSTKIKAGKLDSVPLDSNPYADWSCHLFTVNRAQYIILSNTASLYSCLMFGKGITDESIFIQRVCDTIREFLADDGQQFAYEGFIAPSTAEVQFAKAHNRGVTGSINELIGTAEYLLAAHDHSPHSVGFELNDILLSYIGTKETDGYDRPKNAFCNLSVKLA